MNNVEKVQAIYAAFGRGDAPAMLEHMSPDIRWEQWPENYAQKAEVPYLKARSGHAGVGDFLGTLALLEMHDFQVLGFLDGGRNVAVEVEIEFTVKATGKRLRDQELHLWTFAEDGRAIRLRHYMDTAKHIAANRAG